MSVTDLQDHEPGDDFEFKLVYNNKNLSSQVLQLRADVARNHDSSTRSWGVMILFHLVFHENHWGRYKPNGGATDPETLKTTMERLATAMTAPGDYPPLTWEVGLQQVSTLKNANYIQPGGESGAWVGLVRLQR